MYVYWLILIDSNSDYKGSDNYEPSYPGLLLNYFNAQLHPGGPLLVFPLDETEGF